MERVSIREFAHNPYKWIRQGKESGGKLIVERRGEPIFKVDFDIKKALRWNMCTQ